MQLYYYGIAPVHVLHLQLQRLTSEEAATLLVALPARSFVLHVRQRLSQLPSFRGNAWLARMEDT